MSEDLVNQITLNYLISKTQLQKLNNKIKQKEQDTMKSDKEIYKEQISELFTKCLNDDFPNDLLQEVRNSFTYFIEKSVYYLKLKENRSNEDKSRAEEETVASLEGESAGDEELEEDEEEEEEEDISAADADEEESLEDKNLEAEEVKPQRVYKKTTKPSHSEGVDDINKLPLDWFTKVKYQSQNQNLKEKKNITNVYEIKKNKK
jgi:hypothetical protein